MSAELTTKEKMTADCAVTVENVKAASDNVQEKTCEMVKDSKEAMQPMFDRTDAAIKTANENVKAAYESVATATGEMAAKTMDAIQTASEKTKGAGIIAAEQVESWAEDTKGAIKSLNSAEPEKEQK